MIGDPEVAVPIALACVAFAAFCAGTEVALFSLRRGERDQLARSARRVDRRIAALLARPRPLVTTVLIGHVAAAGTIASEINDKATRREILARNDGAPP